MKRELRLAAATAAVMLLAFAANAYADAARTKTGAALTYLMNGSPVYLGSVSVYDGGFADNASTNGGAGFTSFSISDTAFVYAQCNDAAFLQANKLTTDAGTTVGRSLRLDQFEKFPVGMLQPGNPGVSFAATDAGSVQCAVFELK